MEPEKKHHHGETQNVLNRLSRAAGHLESIKRMVEDERDCMEVLTQLAAVKAAVNRIGRIILCDHMEHCVAEDLKAGETESLEKLKKAMDQFMK